MASMPDIVVNVKTDIQQSGFTAAFFDFFQGRATAFAIVFTVCGLILAFRGKLNANYSVFVGAIQTLIFAHSCKEDWHKQRMEAIRDARQDSMTEAADISKHIL